MVKNMIHLKQILLFQPRGIQYISEMNAQIYLQLYNQLIKLLETATREIGISYFQQSIYKEAGRTRK